ncbi:MAG TPA: type I-D CRISPR-associated protein Cas5/Csc1 [Anaerolineae bacterium]|nr:type I-D CRISPR-associated protein Cas5/Csc1 [Anaerolineae bacterium]
MSADTLHIYRCELTFWEHVFFSSREVGNFFQTEPLLGNYALAYAFGLAQSPYHNDGTVRYALDLGPLNERGVYVTPGTILGEPRFVLSQFNAQADTYWYAFTNNAIVVRPDDRLAVKQGVRWRIIDPVTGEGQFVRPNNYPQHGRIKMLALGNRAICYVLSREPLALPRYVRLGKWMSKAGVTITHATARAEPRDEETVSIFLNPADLPHPERLRVYDLVSVHPVPLVRNAVLSGDFVRAPDGVWLPAGMRFGVEGVG